MLRALITGIIVILCTAGFAFAAPLNVTLPCPSGGDIVVQGDYNFITTVFSLGFAVNNCKKGTATFNGTVTSNGTFSFTSGSTARVDMTAISTITVVGDDDSGTRNCTVGFVGDFNTATQTFAGSSSHNCTATGTISVDIVEILSGFDVF